MFLSGQVEKVHHMIRGGDLDKDMSSYLVQRIEQAPNIEALLQTEVRRMHGDPQLKAVDVQNRKTGEETRLSVVALFSFIGAVPRTDWLPRAVETDARPGRDGIPAARWRRGPRRWPC